MIIIKKLNVLVAIAAIAILFVSCSKDGATGPAGPAGANGSNGNANVKVFTFGPDTMGGTFSSFTTLVLDSSITENMLDSSILLVYHENNGFWYSSPGLGYGADYEVRIYHAYYPVDLYFEIDNPDGSTYTGTEQDITTISVIVAPASVYKGSRMDVNFKDYYATLKFFNLKLPNK